MVLSLPMQPCTEHSVDGGKRRKLHTISTQFLCSTRSAWQPGQLKALLGPKECRWRAHADHWIPIFSDLSSKL